MKDEVSLGVFPFERATKNTKRFTAEDENGRGQTHYVPKDRLAEIGDPPAIEVIIRPVRV